MAVYYKFYDVYYCDHNNVNQQFATRHYHPTFALTTVPSNQSGVTLASLDFTLGSWGIDRSQVTSPIFWTAGFDAYKDELIAAFPNSPIATANLTGASCWLKFIRRDGSFAGGERDIPNGDASYGSSSGPMSTYLYNTVPSYINTYVYLMWSDWGSVTFWGVVDFNGTFEAGQRLYCISISPYPSQQTWYIKIDYQTISSAIANWLNSVEDEEPTPPPPPDTDPYANIDGEGALPGGADVDLPAEPTLSALDAGVFALFAPSSSQMKALAAYLWTDFGGTGTDVTQVLSEIVDALKRSISNPLNSMLGLSIIASQGLSKGGTSSVHVGFWDTGVSMTKLAKQYFTVDCGSLSFSPVCGDTFLDYAPYSKFSIFLPYVGMKTLDANDVVGHTISVKYRGDCVTGGLVCYLKRDGTIIAEFAGNCALNLPLSAESWGQTISGGLSIVAGAVAGGVKGGPAAAATGAVTSAASVATNPSVLAPQVEYTGAVAGGSGHMGSQKPFILREAVRFHSTSHFNTVTGYPSFYYKKLGDCTGFTQVVDVHIHGLSATGAELSEIESLLKGGVIL